MPIGDYAVNIAFSDGHNRGIYPWPYLRLLARADQVSEIVAGAPAPAVAGLTSTMSCLVSGCPLCSLWSAIAHSRFSSGM